MNILLGRIFLVVFCYCTVYVMANDIDYLRTLDDFIAYRISFKPQEEELKYQEGNEEVIVPIMSPDDEQYHCYLPIIEQNTKKRIETYSGPSPADLLKPLYDDSSCSYRIESYWMYEVCHGRYILQYHEDKETKLRTEYYLGNYAKIQADTEAANFDQLNPPTRKFAESQLPYYPVTYYQGTTCDLTNKPRQTTILYVCDESFRSHVHSLNEVSSCNYELVIMTNRLCAHPSFQKLPQKEHDIRCFATDKNQINAKPRRLRNMEHESTSQFFQEFALHKSSSDAPRNVFTRLLQTDDTNDELDQLNVILEALKSAAPKSTISLLTPKMTANEKELVDQFWSGKTCLSGGSGWWKYEICYGRSVTQYHEEVGKERANVVLGMFHKDVHMQWADQNPHKALKTDGERIYQVANMYSKGDLCSETGAHRSCEVRIRCQEESTSPSKVLIYLLEPETCSYILVVESPLLCDGLQKANKYGMLPSMPELEEAEVLHESREISSKDHATSSIQISLRSLDELVQAKDSSNAEEEEASDEGKLGTTTTQKKVVPRAKVDLSGRFGDAIMDHHEAVVEIVQSIVKLKNAEKDNDDVKEEEESDQAETPTQDVDENESDEQNTFKDKEEL